jgi:hypothetical protein
LPCTEATTNRAVPPSVFIPQAFDLYEFDEGAQAVSAGQGRRWFSHWNGLIGSPAEEVTLGWSAGDATVLVGTRGEVHHQPWARHEAALLLLSGDEILLPSRPTSPRTVHLELQRIMSTDKLWSAAPALFAGGPAAQAAVLDGYALAYCMLGDGAVFLAAVGVAPDRFRIRQVRDWAAYDHDATKTFPLSELRR